MLATRLRPQIRLRSRRRNTKRPLVSGMSVRQSTVKPFTKAYIYALQAVLHIPRARVVITQTVGEHMIKKILVLALASGSFTLIFAQTNIGVSIGINQPGVYGRVDIGNYAQPRIVYSQPVVIIQQPVSVQQQPIYLYVPPGHQKNWAKHCARYNACGQPVYFVREDWVRERYEENRNHDDDRDDDRGHSHGKGNGKGNKHKD